jgi:hypothetical protein
MDKIDNYHFSNITKLPPKKEKKKKKKKKTHPK